MRSSFFNISNGVRQGGTLSPKQFSVCMDDQTNLLISSGVGCFLNNVCFNHVVYAVVSYGAMRYCSAGITEYMS